MSEHARFFATSLRNKSAKYSWYALAIENSRARDPAIDYMIKIADIRSRENNYLKVSKISQILSAVSNSYSAYYHFWQGDPYAIYFSEFEPYESIKNENKIFARAHIKWPS